jgi:hypothetical protein
MWKYTLVLLSLATASHAAVQTLPSDAGEIAPPAMRGSATAGYMMISPSARALDYQTAFDMLRKEKTTAKVFFQLSDGSTVSNIIDMTLLSNSTLFLFRCNSQQGIRYQVVKVEDILNINYSP